MIRRELGMAGWAWFLVAGCMVLAGATQVKSVQAEELRSSEHGRFQGGAVALALPAFANGIRLCSRPKPTGMSAVWRVPREQVKRIDAALLEHLRTTGLEKQLTFPSSGYARQYLGFFRDGTRIVYVNAAPAKRGSSVMTVAREHFLEGCDGGGMFWGIEYEVRSKTFVNFAINNAN